MLEGTTPIDTPKHNFKNFKEARAWAKENIVGAYRNSDTGEDVKVSVATIEKCMSAKAVSKSVNFDAHVSALRQIPRLIETAVLHEVKEDTRHSLSIIEVQRFYCAINYENHIYPVKLTVKVVLNEGKRAYSYEVLEVESPKA
jgi:hypothetical protein